MSLAISNDSKAWEPPTVACIRSWRSRTDLPTPSSAYSIRADFSYRSPSISGRRSGDTSVMALWRLAPANSVSEWSCSMLAPVGNNYRGIGLSGYRVDYYEVGSEVKKYIGLLEKKVS